MMWSTDHHAPLRDFLRVQELLVLGIFFPESHEDKRQPRLQKRRERRLRREARRHREQSPWSEETTEERVHRLLVQNQGNRQRRENEAIEHRARRLQVMK